MNWFRNMKLSAKITLITSLLLLLTLGAVGACSIYFSTSGVKALSDDALLNRAQDSAMILSERVDELKLSLANAAAQPALQGKALPDQLKALDPAAFDCLRIGIADASGAVSYTDGTTERIGDKDFYKQAAG